MIAFVSVRAEEEDARYLYSCLERNTGASTFELLLELPPHEDDYFLRVLELLIKDYPEIREEVKEERNPISKVCYHKMIEGEGGAKAIRSSEDFICRPLETLEKLYQKAFRKNQSMVARHCKIRV